MAHTSSWFSSCSVDGWFWDQENRGFWDQENRVMSSDSVYVISASHLGMRLSSMVGALSPCLQNNRIRFLKCLVTLLSLSDKNLYGIVIENTTLNSIRIM